MEINNWIQMNDVYYNECLNCIKNYTLPVIASIICEYTKVYLFEGKIMDRCLLYNDDNNDNEYSDTPLDVEIKINNNVYVLNNYFVLNIFSTKATIPTIPTSAFDCQTKNENNILRSFKLIDDDFVRINEKYFKYSLLGNDIIKADIFISNTIDEILLYVKVCIKKYTYDGHIYVFDSLTGKFKRKFTIYNNSLVERQFYTDKFISVAFISDEYGKDEIFVLDSSKGDQFKVSVFDAFTGSLITQWQHSKYVQLNENNNKHKQNWQCRHICRVSYGKVHRTFNKCDLFFVNGSENSNISYAILICDAYNGKKLRAWSDINVNSVPNIIIHDNFVYITSYRTNTIHNIDGNMIRDIGNEYYQRDCMVFESRNDFIFESISYKKRHLMFIDRGIMYVIEPHKSDLCRGNTKIKAIDKYIRQYNCTNTNYTSLEDDDLYVECYLKAINKDSAYNLEPYMVVALRILLYSKIHKYSVYEEIDLLWRLTKKSMIPLKKLQKLKIPEYIIYQLK